MNYELAYRVGFHPWEDAEGHSPFVEKISELFDREETGRQQPYGPALDLGTGSGIWGVQLALRGWQVTAVDIVDKALGRARTGTESRGRRAARPRRRNGRPAGADAFRCVPRRPHRPHRPHRPRRWTH